MKKISFKTVEWLAHPAEVDHVRKVEAKEKAKEKDYDWVKRLGQWHVYNRDRDEQYKTRCGMPMMGNNYASEIPNHEREKCAGCFKE